jgi:YaiO family outer membrane protein
VNYGYRFQNSGIQGELDFYPKIMNGVYGYLNYGYSGADIFPKHRFGAEVYGRLPSSMEGSLGIRYLYFGPASTVTIYTGSLGLYRGNYYFSLRPYITPNNSSFSRSVSLLVRRYFGDADNYLSVKGSVGFIPDERTVIFSAGESGKETYFLKSENAGIGCQYALTSTHLLTVTFDITHQELSFDPGRYVYDYSFSVGVKTIF